MFYGRTAQLEKLHRFYSGSGMGTALVYGRRRVGKTELIKQSLKTEDSETIKIYYECKQTTELNNTESLSILLSEVLDLPPLGFHSIEQILEYILDYGSKHRLILVLDEYSYLRDAIKGMDSILQALIDKYSKISMTKLVLCGSYVEIMRSLLENSNPLYGRIDLSMFIEPMDYYESALFYPDYSSEDKVRLFSVFGGIPYYNRQIDTSLSVKDNIENLISAPDARFENEVSMYIRSEISKITNANEVFETLAKGFSKYSDILSQSHVSSSPTLADVLTKLINMGVVEKHSPINDPDNRKKTKYFISDHLSLFYYRYIFPYLSQRSYLDEETFYSRYINENFESQYVPHVFETVCKQYLIRKNRQGQIDPPFDSIGRYYYDDPINRTNGEFDVVTKDPLGFIFYEVKFRKDPISKSIIDEGIKQIDRTGLKCYKYVFFSRSGFSCDPEDNLVFVPIDDLYR